MGDYWAPLDFSSPSTDLSSYDALPKFDASPQATPTGLNNSEVSFLQGFPKYNQSWLTPSPTPSLGTSFSSPTPNNTGSNATPDVFGGLFSGLIGAVGQGANALIQGGAQNLANRIAAQPTLKAPAKTPTTSAGIIGSVSSFLTPGNLLIAGVAIAVVIYIARK